VDFLLSCHARSCHSFSFAPYLVHLFIHNPQPLVSNPQSQTVNFIHPSRLRYYRTQPGSMPASKHNTWQGGQSASISQQQLATASNSQQQPATASNSQQTSQQASQQASEPARQASKPSSLPASLPASQPVSQQGDMPHKGTTSTTK
jgi:hypothetical protein